jgi:glycosyltransferase involved in cell wall biosynthesis
MENFDLTIIVPCYNEEESIPKVIPELLRFCNENLFKLIIVNDGSIDNSKALLDKYANGICKIYHHKVNRGYGGAIKTGIINADSQFIVTIDADGQHYLEDIFKLINKLQSTDADMVIGSRKGHKDASFLKQIGKFIIRNLTNFLIPTKIYDINSGMKLYRLDLAKKFLHLYPDTMAFSDIIVMVYIHNRHLVVEELINIKPRKDGSSKITIQSAFLTIRELLNIIVLFNPLKIFLNLSIIFFIIGLIWGIPIVLNGNGISVGSMLAIMTSILLFGLGLIAEQLSQIRKKNN